jgi:hypothetical protein
MGHLNDSTIAAYLVIMQEEVGKNVTGKGQWSTITEVDENRCQYRFSCLF